MNRSCYLVFGLIVIFTGCNTSKKSFRITEGLDAVSDMKQWMGSVPLIQKDAKAGVWPGTGGFSQDRSQYFYRFNTDPKNIDSIVSELKLKKVDLSYGSCMFPPDKRFDPYLASWWNPSTLTKSQCYSGYVNQDNFPIQLSYDTNNNLAYIFIHK